MTHRLLTIIGGLALLGLASACQWPTQPSTSCVSFGGEPPGALPSGQTTVNCDSLINQPGPVTAGGGTGGDGGSGTGGDGGTGGEGGEGAPPGGDDSTGNPPSGPASIIASGRNDEGAVIYQIGPGAPPGGDDSTGNPPSGPASIIASGRNDEGAVIYQIGPGQVFTRTGGDAATVWCRPASDCNGEGGNRTAVNAASPPVAWIADRQAVFRRSGTVGTTVTFTVDGVTLAHDFSTGG